MHDIIECESYDNLTEIVQWIISMMIISACQRWSTAFGIFVPMSGFVTNTTTTVRFDFNET